jgi:hypothetical protein
VSTAAAILATARRELGVVESPPNSNHTKFGVFYGMDRVAWCAIYVWWVFQHTPGAEQLIPKTAYTPTFANWFRKQGRWGTSPRPGAVVFFDFPNDGVNRISHVGIVEAVNRDGSVICLEGNTSPGVAGSQRDGGGVYRRTRKTGIVGYGYPAYATTSKQEDDMSEHAEKQIADIHKMLFGQYGVVDHHMRLPDNLGGVLLRLAKQVDDLVNVFGPALDYRHHHLAAEDNPYGHVLSIRKTLDEVKGLIGGGSVPTADQEG